MMNVLFYFRVYTSEVGDGYASRYISELYAV